jgi:hypothetical protein
MPKSIDFKVLKWQYNNKIPLINTRTETNLFSYPLRKLSDPSNSNQGIVFKWVLVITANNLEVLYYSTQEMVLIPDKNISNERLKDIVKETYQKASLELIRKNIPAGLNAGFPEFDTIKTMDIKEIKKVLQM